MKLFNLDSTLDTRLFLPSFLRNKVLITIVLLIVFVGNTLVSSVYGQNLAQLVMGAFDQTYYPLVLKGVAFDYHNPFTFEFFLESGKTQSNEVELKRQTKELIEYFLVGLTVPEKDLWVNLSFYEKDRIIADSVNKTAIAVNFLDQDFLLKKLTSSLTMPETKEGQQFWKEIYKKIYELYGTTKLPVDVLNRVWIVPDEAQVIEYKNKAFVTKASLKILMEEDYLALQQSSVTTTPGHQTPVKPTLDDGRPLATLSGLAGTKDEGQKDVGRKDQNSKSLPQEKREEINKVSVQIMKEKILPLIEQEINTSKDFAPLRQLYHSLILAMYFKNKLKQGIHYLYVNQNKTGGLKQPESKSKEEIYQQYIDLYQKGVYDYIKREYDPYEQKTLKRRYVSGGVVMGEELARAIRPMVTENSRLASSVIGGSIKRRLLKTSISLKDSQTSRQTSSSAISVEEKYHLNTMRGVIQQKVNNGISREKAVGNVVADRVANKWDLSDLSKTYLEKALEEGRFPFSGLFYTKAYSHSGIGSVFSKEDEQSLRAEADTLMGIFKNEEFIKQEETSSTVAEREKKSKIDYSFLTEEQRRLWLENWGTLDRKEFEGLSYWDKKDRVLAGATSFLTGVITLWAGATAFHHSFLAGLFITLAGFGATVGGAVVMTVPVLARRNQWKYVNGDRSISFEDRAERDKADFVVREINKVGRDLFSIFKQVKEIEWNLHRDILEHWVELDYKLQNVDKEFYSLVRDNNHLLNRIKATGKVKELMSFIEVMQAVIRLNIKYLPRIKAAGISVHGTEKDVSIADVEYLEGSQKVSENEITRFLNETRNKLVVIEENLNSVLEGMQADEIAPEAYQYLMRLLTRAHDGIRDLIHRVQDSISIYEAAGRQSEGFLMVQRLARLRDDFIDNNASRLKTLGTFAVTDYENGKTSQMLEQGDTLLTRADELRNVKRAYQEHVRQLRDNLLAIQREISEGSTSISAGVDTGERFDEILKDAEEKKSVEQQFIRERNKVSSSSLSNSNKRIERVIAEILDSEIDVSTFNERYIKDLFRKFLTDQLSFFEAFWQLVSTEDSDLDDSEAKILLIAALFGYLKNIPVDATIVYLSDEVDYQEILEVYGERIKNPAAFVADLHAANDLLKYISNVKAAGSKQSLDKSVIWSAVKGTIQFGLALRILLPLSEWAWTMLSDVIVNGVVISLLTSLGVKNVRTIYSILRDRGSYPSIMDFVKKLSPSTYEALLKTLRAPEESISEKKKKMPAVAYSLEEMERQTAILKQKVAVFVHEVKMSQDFDDLSAAYDMFKDKLDAHVLFKTLEDLMINSAAGIKEHNLEAKVLALRRMLKSVREQVEEGLRDIKMYREWVVDKAEFEKHLRDQADSKAFIEAVNEPGGIEMVLRERAVRAERAIQELNGQSDRISTSDRPSAHEERASGEVAYRELDERLEEVSEQRGNALQNAKRRILGKRNTVSSSSLSASDYDSGIKKHKIYRSLGIAATVLGVGAMFTPIVAILLGIDASILAVMGALVGGAVSATGGLFAWVNSASQLDWLRHMWHKQNAAQKLGEVLRTTVQPLPEGDISTVTDHFKESIKFVVSKIRLLQHFGVKGAQKQQAMNNIRENIDALNKQIDEVIARFEKELLLDSEKEALRKYQDVLRRMQEGLDKGQTHGRGKKRNQTTSDRFAYDLQKILDAWRDAIEAIADIVGSDEYENTIAPLFTEDYSTVLPDVLPEVRSLSDFTTAVDTSTGLSTEGISVGSVDVDTQIDIPQVDTTSFTPTDFGGGFNSSSSINGNGTQRGFEQLKKLLGSRIAARRLDAVAGLRQIDISSKDIVDLLIKAAADDSSEQVRIGAINALGDHGGIQAVKGLQGMLEKAPTEERMRIFHALKTIGGDYAIKTLIEYLPRAGSLSEKKEIYSILGKVRGDLAINALEAALYDKDPYMRIFVLRVLKSTGDVDSIIGALDRQDPRNSDPRFRLEAARALRSMGHSWKISRAFIKALGDPDAQIREVATLALGGAREERAVQGVIGVTTDQVRKVRLSAIETLAAIGDNPAVFGLTTVLAEQSGVEKRRAIEALGKIGNDNAIDVLEAVLRNGDRDSRMTVLDVLGGVETPAANRALVAGLEKELSASERVRDKQMMIAVIEILGKRKELYAFSSLMKALGNNDIQIRAAAAIGIEKIIGTIVMAAEQSQKMEVYRKQFAQIPASDLTRQRVSLQEAIRSLGEIGPSLRKKQFQVYPLIQAAAEYFPNEGVDVFVSNRLPAIKEYIVGIEEDLKNIEHLRIFAGFTDASTRERIENSLTLLAQVFGGDKAMAFFGSRQDFTYSIGMSESEVAAYYEKGSDAGMKWSIQHTSKIKSALGVIPVTIIIGGSSHDASRSVENADRQRIFKEIVEAQNTVWAKAYDQVAGEYKDYYSMMQRLQNDTVSVWNDVLLPDFKELENETLISKGRVSLSEEALYLLRSMQMRLSDLLNETAVNGFFSYRGDKKPQNIVPIARSLGALYKDIAERKGLTVKMTSESEELAGNAIDPLLLQRALDIVLNNAVRFTDTGTIEIKLYRGSFYRQNMNERQAGIILEITDPGKGLSRLRREEIFLAGKGQVKPDNNNKGLDFVRRAVRSMGGDIRVISQEEKGTAVSIFLPEYTNGTIALKASGNGNNAAEPVENMRTPDAAHKEDSRSTITAKENDNYGGIDLSAIQDNLKVKQEMEQLDAYPEYIQPYLDKIDVEHFMGYSFTMNGFERVSLSQILR